MGSEDLELKTASSEYTCVDGVWRKNGKEIGPACYVSEDRVQEMRELHKKWIDANRGQKGAAERYPGYLLKLIDSGNKDNYREPGGSVVYIRTKPREGGGERLELKASDVIFHYKGPTKKQVGGDLPKAKPVSAFSDTPPELPGEPYAPAEPGAELSVEEYLVPDGAAADDKGPADDDFKLADEGRGSEEGDSSDSSDALEFLKDDE